MDEFLPSGFRWATEDEVETHQDVKIEGSLNVPVARVETGNRYGHADLIKRLALPNF